MPINPNSPWNSQNEEVLVVLYTEKKSARWIASALNGMGYLSITRNAVIGKIHRLGLPPRPVERPFNLAPRKRNRVSKILEQRGSIVRSAPVWVEPLPTAAPEGSNLIPFLETRDGQCKAILAYQDGDPAKALCCGVRTRRRIKGHKVVATSWCDYHMRIYVREEQR